MALLKYTGLRIVIFVVIAALLYAVGVRNLFVNAMLAILLSGVLSLFLLDRVREDAGATLERRWGAHPMQRISDRMDASARAEDEADDAARAAQSGQATRRTGCRAPRRPRRTRPRRPPPPDPPFAVPQCTFFDMWRPQLAPQPELRSPGLRKRSLRDRKRGVGVVHHATS